MTEPQIPADVQERLCVRVRQLIPSLAYTVDASVKLTREYALATAAYRLGLSQREAQPLPLPQGELSSDLRQLAMDMGPFWAGVLDSAAMHLDQHAQREAQLRALRDELREAGMWRSVKPPGASVTLSELNAAYRRVRDVQRDAADKIDALLTPQEQK